MKNTKDKATAEMIRKKNYFYYPFPPPDADGIPYGIVVMLCLVFALTGFIIGIILK